MYKVRKRDGKVVKFDISKISDAMKKAFEAEEEQYDDDVIEYALSNLYTIDWNYCPTKEYNEDKQDWMIDWKNFGYKTNWHSVDVICKNWQRSVKDSGSRPEINIYWLKHKLSELTNYGEWFYIFTLVKEDKVEEIKRLNEIKAESLIAIEHLWKIYNLINDKALQKELHNLADKLRAKVKTCDSMLKDLV